MQPADAKPAVPNPLTPSLSPIRGERFGYEQARHLLWRAGFGGTPEQINLLVTWGPEKSVERLLDTGKAGESGDDERSFRSDIMGPPTPEQQQIIQRARRSQDEDTLAKVRLARMERERDDRAQVRQMQRWWLTRMIESPRPMQEKMTLFWHGHFATSYRTIEDSYHMYQQNRLFRRHAMGNFGELLKGIVRDPAMLAYLDNNDSRKGKPNENLAREVMELFALGVGNYSERDIKEGARALTGYSFRDDEFIFQKNNHDATPKTILGNTGDYDGDEFVQIILSQRACSRFIARKLYGFLVADLPPLEATDNDRTLPAVTKAVIDDLAGDLRGSKYDLKPVLRRLLLSEHFYHPRIIGQQIKSPAQLIVGAVRSLNTPVRDLGVLIDAMDLMGQDLFYPPSVKGWDGGRSWINTSTLFVRQNALSFLITGRRPSGADPLAQIESYDPGSLLKPLAAAGDAAIKDHAQVAEFLLKLTIGSAPKAAMDPLVELARSESSLDRPELLRRMLLLITAMPEYQLC